MEEFAAKLGGFTPDLVVVGGLQMMDNFPFQSGMGTVDPNPFFGALREGCVALVFLLARRHCVFAI